jgi:hypothetical protein
MGSKDHFQSRSTKVGTAFRRDCQDLLESIGYTFNQKRERLDEVGISVELIYENKYGVALFFEVAGTDEEEPASERPGLERTDTVKKIIATAFLAHRATGRSTIVLTSHIPNPDSSSGKMLNLSGRYVIYDVINIYSDRGIEILKGYFNMDERFFEQVNDDKSLF